jgi:endo-1,3-1,4-beta-glycanase ExoK
MVYYHIEENNEKSRLSAAHNKITNTSSRRRHDMQKNNIPGAIPARRRQLWLITLLVGCTTTLIPLQEVLAKRGGKPPVALGSFSDHLDTYDTSRWLKADGWKNGPPFDNAWQAENITFSGGTMDIRLDDQAALGEPYSSGNYQSTGFYGYGCYEASFKPVFAAGVVSSFFTFAGPFDNGGNGSHNEIDIEFLGYDTTRFQTNWWTNDDSYTGGHEHVVGLGFDASEEFHRYGFRWTATGIEWFVDGAIVFQVFDSAEDPTPRAEESLQKIMMNVWPVDETATTWAGTFSYPEGPLHGIYDWVRHIAGEDCSLAEAPELPPPPPPPPQGDAVDMHIAEVSVGLNSRETQAIARVIVMNGLGEPVADATVDGAWSGIITRGDTRRTTDATGTATFYSARSRDSGDVTFCVMNISKDGMNHDDGADVEACDTVSK